MISLLGKEFDPPVGRKQDPSTAMKISGFWIVLSIAWLGITAGKVTRLQASGGQVSGLRYAAVVFWMVVLLFWVWNAWKSFGKYRAERE